MPVSDKLYYLVDENGCVYCQDGGFYATEQFAKRKAYRRLKAALAAAATWGKYKRMEIRVLDNEGNEVE